MSLTLNLKELKNDIIENFYRFPMSVASSILGAICFIIAVEKDGEGIGLQFIELGMVGLLGIVLFAIIDIWLERNENKGLLVEWAAHISGVIFLLAFYIFLDLKPNDFPVEQGIAYTGTLLILHLIASFIPYIGKRHDYNFWEYNKQIFTNWLIGGFYVMIIYLGLALALLAVDELFELNIKGARYFQLFLMIAGLVHVQHFFSQFPEDYDFRKNELAYNRFFASLCKFILIPLIGIYFIILYAYGLKILLAWELPKGGLAALILAMSIAGILTYLLNFRLSSFSENTLVKWFKNYFWIIFLPLTGLLLAAAYRRISDYGITEERYILASLTSWLILISAYFTITKIIGKGGSIILIPVSLAFFALFTCFGPYNAIKVGVKSQANRLVDLVSENGGLTSKGTFDFSKRFDPETESQITSKINYLSDRKTLQLLENYFPQSFIDTTENIDRFDILDAWKIQSFSIYSSENVTQYINLYRNRVDGPSDIDIAKYSRMVEFDYYFQNTTKNIRIENNQIIIDHKNPVILDKQGLIDLAKSYQAESFNNSSNIEVNEIMKLNDQYDILINNLNVVIRKDNEIIESVSGIVFER